MATKLNRILVVLLVCQVGILIAMRLSCTDHDKQIAKKIFADLQADQITKIDIEDNEKKKIVLSKTDQGWVLSSSGDYPLRKDKAADFLAKLPALTATQPVSSKVAHHRALEVADADFQRRVSLTKKDGSSIQFYLGSSPGIKNVHLRLDKEDHVYLVNGLSSWDLGMTPSSWVDTEYFKVDREKLISLTLQNSNGEIQLTKGKEGKWEISGLSSGSNLKDSEIDSFINSVTSVSLREPVGKKIEAGFGLEKPVAVLTLITQEPTKENEPQELKQTTHMLSIGTKVDDDYYAKSSSSDFVVRLASWTADSLLKKKISDFEEKKDGK
ncbi:MAG: DUF4340 domain-containing protein [Pseudomonadota bacterium]